MGLRFGSHRRSVGHVLRQIGKQRTPGTVGCANDFVARTFAADVFIGRNGGQNRNARIGSKGLSLAGTVIFVDDHASHADVATELAEVLDRAAHVVGHIQRLQVVGGDHDDFLAHIASNRQTETAADHVAKEVKQHKVKAPLMKTEFFKGFKTVDDAAATAAATDLGTTEFHGIDAISNETNVANLDFFTREFFLGRGFDDGGAGFATEQQTGGVALGVATDEQHLLALLGHHVTEVGQGEAFANAALAINGNDLGFLGDLAGVNRIRLNKRLLAQAVYKLNRFFVGSTHQFLQSITIFKQWGSPKAIS